MLACRLSPRERQTDQDLDAVPTAPPGPTAPFDRALLLRRRERSARAVEMPDFLLQRVADDLAERLSIIKRSFPLMVNIGAHDGLLSRRIRGIAGIARIIDMDRSLTLLRRGNHEEGDWRIVADEEALPFAALSLDLAVSGLALQLVNDLPGALVQIRRALRPDGLFLAALLGGETLKELRHAWLVAETEVMGGVSPRVAPFADVRDLGALLQRAGFALPVVDSETVTVTYQSPLALMRELKAMGASNMLASRRRVPVTARLLARACEVYIERFALPGGRVPATFEILTLTAWAPDESQPKPLRPGSAKARLADALGVPERKLRD
jgi:NADH dehydrogenase [ubiquinone] 1 alpha subcomplex assembly factor 5